MLQEPDYVLPNENGFKGTVLDEYLALGFYRMQHIIFTTHHTRLDLGGNSVPVFWLRTLLPQVQEQPSAIAIRKKCAAFSVTYKKATITPETEALYSLYRESVNFSTSETSRSYLHQFEFENPFDSWMVEVRDATRLIAVGYFDKGSTAIAGILNFYHPEYKKYSLGKYLILKKMDFAIENKMPWYYTGYISTANTKFDYKLFPDATAVEVYLPVENKWLPYNALGKPLLLAYFIKYLM